MSEQPEARRKPKVTRRRDSDPVRVYDDGRIAYWTGGRPGSGKRLRRAPAQVGAVAGAVAGTGWRRRWTSYGVSADPSVG